MIYLVLSFDYEFFGNGSGDVRRDMIEPTRRLLTLCNRYNAKATIFFEVGEYWAMKKAEEKGSLSVDYSPSYEIEEQVRDAVRSGHDVQLHLHPWWVGASLVDGHWQLYPNYKRITDLPYSPGSERDLQSVVGVLSRGKHTLEALIRPVCPDYSCLVYRAAMFWGQPSGTLIKGLKRIGLLADSSVVKGLYERAPVPTDYRRAESDIGYWWTGSDDISQSGPIGEHIVEFPVYSRMQPYFFNFKWTKLRTTLKRHFQERTNLHGHGMMRVRKSTDSLGQVFRKLFTLQSLKYDFCKLSGRDMIRWLSYSIKNNPESKNNFGTPMVMLGHSKDFWNDRNLEIFFKYIQNKFKEEVRFSTLGELVKCILKKDNIQRSPIDQKSLPVSHN